MSNPAASRTFRIAPMDPPILWITTFLLALPIALLVGALFAGRLLSIVALLVAAVYAWVWLRFRPRQFAVTEHSLEVRWPMKRRTIPRAEILNVRVMEREALQKEIGWGLRIGAGGLWGGFGWLWTRRRGIVQMYISRTDFVVWIERRDGRPWILTPEQPENFVRALLRSEDRRSL